MIPAPEAHTFKKQETLVRAFGYEGPFGIPRILLTEDDKKITALLPPRDSRANQRCCRVGLFLGNGRNHIRRRWSLEKYAALARRVVHTLECQIIVLWGPDERSLAMEFQNMTKGLTPQPWCNPPTTVREMAALLECVDVLVATTTGPLHLAEAMGTPVVALCRQQAYQGWRPLAASHRIVQALGENIDVIEVETVFESVKEILDPDPGEGANAIGSCQRETTLRRGAETYFGNRVVAICADRGDTQYIVLVE